GARPRPRPAASSASSPCGERARPPSPSDSSGCSPYLPRNRLDSKAPVFELGNSLREARLRQGLDFPELEQATKIRAKYLRAPEQEEFEQLPGPTYVKGFLRSYAEYLGLDGQLYVDEYNSRFLVGEEEAPFRPRRSSAGRPQQRRIESNVILLALAGIALVTPLVF